jgi:hypothetical protein
MMFDDLRGNPDCRAIGGNVLIDEAMGAYDRVFADSDPGHDHSMAADTAIGT